MLGIEYEGSYGSQTFPHDFLKQKQICQARDEGVMRLSTISYVTGSGFCDFVYLIRRYSPQMAG